jgi:hypothetical protein
MIRQQENTPNVRMLAMGDLTGWIQSSETIYTIRGVYPMPAPHTGLAKDSRSSCPQGVVKSPYTNTAIAEVSSKAPIVVVVVPMEARSG